MFVYRYFTGQPFSFVSLEEIKEESSDTDAENTTPEIGTTSNQQF